MINVLYIEAYSDKEKNQKGLEVRIPLESLITYCV